MAEIEHLGIRETRKHLSDVVHKAATRRRRTVITNNGRDVAVIMSVAEVEDLEDRAAYAEWRRSGSPTVGTLEDSARELGIVMPETHGRAA
jgi:prevent-host-death family protein